MRDNILPMVKTMLKYLKSNALYFKLSKNNIHNMFNFIVRINAF